MRCQAGQWPAKEGTEEPTKGGEDSKMAPPWPQLEEPGAHKRWSPTQALGDPGSQGEGFCPQKTPRSAPLSLHHPEISPSLGNHERRGRQRSQLGIDGQSLSLIGALGSAVTTCDLAASRTLGPPESSPISSLSLSRELSEAHTRPQSIPCSSFPWQTPQPGVQAPSACVLPGGLRCRRQTSCHSTSQTGIRETKAFLENP